MLPIASLEVVCFSWRPRRLERSLERSYEIAEAETLLQRVVEWREQSNLYSEGRALLRIFDRREPGRSISITGRTSKAGIASGNWQTPDHCRREKGARSTQAVIPGNKATKYPEQVTPEDFRLMPDSARLPGRSRRQGSRRGRRPGRSRRSL